MGSTARFRRLFAAVGAAMLLSGHLAPVAAYPPADAGYLNYSEMVATIRDIASGKPSIARIFSIGLSHEGRELWAAKISDNVGVDEDEPEVVFDGGVHGREHLSTEMAVALFRNLLDGYGVRARLTHLVDENEITIIFNLNPDGSEYDHRSGTYRLWRKNRQPTPNSDEIGTDVNRNFGYRWGRDPLTASPQSETYGGPDAWSTPEASAFRNYVEGRVVDGEQQIRVHVTFHQYGRIVLYPYGYTSTAIPADMHPEDHEVLAGMAHEMAERSRYASAQSSGLYINAGNQMDWLYGRYRIMTFTLEMGDWFYMPDEEIATETGRNMNAAYYAIEQASCPYALIGRPPDLCDPNPFIDIGSSRFYLDILWLSEHEITTGCGRELFCPTDSVTRAQMATFLSRAFRLPAASRDYFTDDEASGHEAAINRLAEAGLTIGCGSNRFCPDRPVERAPMATFLARALELPPPSDDYFTDDNDSVHEDNINRLAEANITSGCGDQRFCPGLVVKRETMAAFLHRALGD
jgi:hypothetical protein